MGGCPLFTYLRLGRAVVERVKIENRSADGPKIRVWYIDIPGRAVRVRFEQSLWSAGCIDQVNVAAIVQGVYVETATREVLRRHALPDNVQYTCIVEKVDKFVIFPDTQ